MEILYGMLAVFCLYLGFSFLSLYWQRYRAGEVIIPDRFERQTLLFSLVFVAFGIVLVLSIFGVIELA